MLEIPESQTISRQLRETIGGSIITKVEAAASPHGFAWYFGDPADYPRLLTGKRVEDVAAMAGYVEIRAEETRLVFHDGVNVRYLAAQVKAPLRHQLYVSFADGGQIVCTVQMYGGLLAFPAGAHDNYYYRVAKEKPSPLSGAFDEAYFTRLFTESSPKLSLKAFLATEQRIPGLGNGCLQDILFQARLHPQSKLSSLNEEDMRLLFSSLKKTLAAMTKQGGRDTEKDLFGRAGGYRTILSAKTVKDPCPVCGGAIIRKAYLGGNIYFCPHCQYHDK
ncbi:MAG: endonuclease VIII [Clostridiales bacterium]|nr:endonuclease VIII [Clostridiales bacterium]